MKSKELAAEAIIKTRCCIDASTDNERYTLNNFIDVFEAEIEGWKIRIHELDDDDDDE